MRYSSSFNKGWTVLVLAAFLCLGAVSASGQEVRSIRVGIPGALPPFSFVDEESGGIRGFSVDLSILLLAGLDRKIAFVSGTPADLKEALRKGTVDLISGVALGRGEEPSFSIIETDIAIERHYFANRHCVTITCHRDLPGKTVAVDKGSDHLDVDVTRQDIHFVEVETPLDALKLVDSGGADVTIAYSDLSAQYLIQKNALANVKQVGFAVESLPLCVAVRRDNPELLKELSVAFGRILENRDYLGIREKWLGKGIPIDPLAREIRKILWVAGGILFVTFVLLVWNRMLKRKVNQVTRNLQISESKYRHLIESSPEMIFLVSEGGRIVLSNQVALQSLGYTEAEVLRLTLKDLVIPDHHNEMEDLLDTVFAHGFAQGESVFLGKGDSLIHVETIATMVKETDRGQPLACCFTRDITERRRLEEELMQSEKLATMGQVAAGLAHEINNPLGILLVNAQEALTGWLDPDTLRKSLEVIERNALRAGKIVEDLLSYTRPSGYDPVAVDLDAVVEEAIFMLRPSLKRKHISVEKHICATSLRFCGDLNQIEQLLINLILNSIEAVSDHGAIKISTGVEMMNDTQRITIEVEDDGVGIAEEDLPKIFDPFFSASKKKGFGLGLSIAKRIVEKHGGVIIAHSRKGCGTSMKMIFPVAHNGGGANG